MNAKNKILFLSAAPDDQARLRADRELRDVDEALRRAGLREQFHLVSRHAVRPADLRRAVLEENPDILHFAGHGEAAGLVLEDDQGQTQTVPAAALAELFRLFSAKLRCVVLNACYSGEQAEAIAAHIAYVAGMRTDVSDQAAHDFAVAFYDALGNGRDIGFAFDYARNAVHLAGHDAEASTPVLLSGTSQNLSGLSVPRRRFWLVGTVLILLLAAVAFFFVPAPPAPEPGLPAQSLAGAVRDTAGEPLPGVTVALPVHGVSAVTDKFGYFRLQVHASHQAEVELLAQKPGYRTHEQYATLGNTSLSFIMVRTD